MIESKTCPHDSFKIYRQAVYSSEFKEHQLKRDMMLLGHSLEKGMSFNKKKEGWGRDKALRLCELVKDYSNHQYDKSAEYVSVINILNAYKNDEYACKDMIVQSVLNEILSNNKFFIEKGRAGIKQINQPMPFNKEEIIRFYQTRSSVRDFSETPISQKEIDSVLKFAELTPSACNRQATRVYAIRNKKKINEYLALQLGGQGWCENADTLFLITGNMSLFGGVYERHQVYIDGGLYAMNFVMGLHLAGIASCFKMFVREPKLQKSVHELCNIPYNEVPIVCILAGHYKDEPVNDPISFRIERKTELVD